MSLSSNWSSLASCFVRNPTWYHGIPHSFKSARTEKVFSLSVSACLIANRDHFYHCAKHLWKKDSAFLFANITSLYPRYSLPFIFALCFPRFKITAIRRIFKDRKKAWRSSLRKTLIAAHQKTFCCSLLSIVHLTKNDPSLFYRSSVCCSSLHLTEKDIYHYSSLICLLLIAVHRS